MKEHNLTILIPAFSSTFFSSLFSLITCGIFLRYRDLSNNYASRLIFILSLTDVLVWGNHSINFFYYLVSDKDLEELSHNYCIISSVFRCINGLINLYCIFIIGFSLYINTICNKDPLHYEKPAMIIIFFLSLVLSLIPLLLNHYGKLDDIQCWITDPYTNFFVFYLSVLFVLISNSYFVVKVIIKLYRKKQTNIIKELVARIFLYPLILLISWLPSVIRVLTGKNDEILVIFSYCCMPLQGILNPFIYGRIFFTIKNKINDSNNPQKKLQSSSVSSSFSDNSGLDSSL